MIDLELMKSICCLNDEDLEENLINFLFSNSYKGHIQHLKGSFIMAEGDLPICLIAHVDTVFTFPPRKDDFFYDQEKQILWSPYGSGFDDRAGITMIIQLILKGYHPSIIFTFDEEVSGEGAKDLISYYKTCPFKCNALIELDRMNEKDCVFYQCDNKNFVKYIESFGFKEAQGSFTDISFIAPRWKIAATNLSIGYLDEHTISERLNLSWYNQTFEKLIAILDNSKNMKFYKYIPKKIQNISHLGNRTTCFLCGAPLWKKKIKITENNGIQFYCCENCYDVYYNNNFDNF